MRDGKRWLVSSLLWIAVAVPGAVPRSASADNGVTNDTILIGQSAGLTGSGAALVKQQIAGAETYFNALNKRGGVAGRKIVLKTVDDGFDPKRTLTNTTALIETDGVFALFMMGALNDDAPMLALLEKEGIPSIAPVDGSMAMRKPLVKWIFNGQASYQDEVAAAVNHLVTTNVTRIAMLYPNDAFGRDARAGFEAALATRKIQPTLIFPFHRPMTSDVSAVDALKVAHPDAIFVIGSDSEASRFIKDMHAADSKVIFVTLSNNASDAFIATLGESGRGTILTQVAPGSVRVSTPLVKEYFDQARADGAEPSGAGVRGYIAAKIFAEGLKRAGKNPTRAQLMSALETMRNFDVGGVLVTYTPENHAGINFVETSIISSSGQLMR